MRLPHARIASTLAMATAVAGSLVGACSPQGPSNKDGAHERLAVTRSALGTFNVLTRCYDNTQDCANLSETTITQNTVLGGNRPGVTFSVDDRVFAQPLYASSVSISGSSHNVLYVSTMANSIYAFDADTGSLLWHQNYNPGTGVQVTSATVVNGAGCNDQSINSSGTAGDIGIEGTPVIDGVGGVIYFVTAKKTSSTTMQYWLHAVDMTSGSEKTGSPTQVTTTGFNEEYEQQRAALALASGYVYIAFSAFCDSVPSGGMYHGYVFAYSYSGTSFSSPSVFNSTPGATSTSSCATGGACGTNTQCGGGVWQSAAGPAIDSSGNVYYAVGNGLYDGTTANDYGNSVVKLSSGTVTPQDWFTPNNQLDLASCDLDVGAGSPSLFPNPSTFGSNLVQGGKEGKVYTLSVSSLGHLASSSTCTQTATPPCLEASIQCESNSNAAGTIRQIVLWQNPNVTPTLNMYIWGSGDRSGGTNGGDILRLYQYTSGSFSSTSSTWSPTGCSPTLSTCTSGCSNGGGWMSLSANGSTSGTGVLWAIGPGIQQGAGRTLYAFKAEDLSLLWSTSVGNVRRWVPPIVANGALYVAGPDGSSYVTKYTFPCTSAHPWSNNCGKCQTACGTGSHWDDTCCLCARNTCPSGEYWDETLCSCQPL